MRNQFLLIKLFAGMLIAAPIWAEDPHGHKHDESHHDEQEAPHKGESHEEEHESEAGHDEELSSNIGPGFAVTEADHDQGFKLSEKALKTLGLEWKPVQNASAVTVPSSSLVFFKDETGVYRVRDGWIKLIEGEVEITGKSARFMPQDKTAFKSGDQIVTAGVPLLRVTELDTFSGSEAGHAH
jgi:hypothetical protein